MDRKNVGWIEVVTGPMFAGKTEELIRRASQAQFAGQKVQAFKHTWDDRYHEQDLVSHSKSTFPSIAVPEAKAILNLVNKGTRVVVIDEAQFFDFKLPEVCNKLANRRIRVIVGGLDLDFRGESFGPVPTLLAQAEEVTKLHSICAVCGNWATRTQRLVDGQPAPYYAPIIVVGAADIYQPRCRRCHKVPDKKKKRNN